MGQGSCVNGEPSYRNADDLVSRLEGIAAAEHTIQELTTEWLLSLAELGTTEHRSGSPSAVLQALLDPPIHPPRTWLNSKRP